jgi:hypothetical protein
MKGLMRGTVFFSAFVAVIAVLLWLVAGCTSERKLTIGEWLFGPAKHRPAAVIGGPGIDAGEPEADAEAGPPAPIEISQDVAGVKAEASLWAKVQAVASVFKRDVIITGDGNQVSAGGVWRYALGYLVALWIRPWWRRPRAAAGALSVEDVAQLMRAFQSTLGASLTKP